MNSKALIWIGLFIGSTAGSFVPALWHAGALSVSGVLCSALGGIVGIWCGYRLGR